jgi:uncharacterized membrane protein YccC
VGPRGPRFARGCPWYQDSPPEGRTSLGGMVTAPEATWRFAPRPAFFHGLSAAIVAVFAYTTANLVPSLPETYWAPMAAVVVLYPDGQATRKAAVERFFGTIVGCLVGWGAAATWHGHVLVYGLAVVGAVGLCYLLRLEGAARLAAVAVTVITLIPRPEPADLIAFHRFVEVSYGVACAFVYMVVVDRVFRRGLPPQAASRSSPRT